MGSTKLALLLAASSATTVLAQTTLAASYNGYSYLGCYSDNSGDRALANQGPAVPGGSANMTIQNCIDTCSDTYSYVGLEYYDEVSGSSLGVGTVLILESVGARTL